MKIALIIYGFVRDIEQSYKEHKFFLDNYDCDIYISTWNILGKKKSPKVYGDKSTDWTDYEELLDVNKLLSLFNPIAYEIDDIQDFNNKYDDTFINNYLKKYNFTSYSRCKNSIIGQYYRIKSLWKLFNTNKNDNAHYDLIIRSRFDNKFPTKITLNNIIKDNSIYVTNWWGRDIKLDGVNDFLFITHSYETMNIICNVFNYVLTSKNMLSNKYILPQQGRSGPVPELIVAHLLRINNIKINNLGIKMSLIK